MSHKENLKTCIIVYRHRALYHFDLIVTLFPLHTFYNYFLTFREFTFSYIIICELTNTFNPFALPFNVINKIL